MGTISYRRERARFLARKGGYLHVAFSPALRGWQPINSVAGSTFWRTSAGMVVETISLGWHYGKCCPILGVLFY